MSSMSFVDDDEEANISKVIICGFVEHEIELQPLFWRARKKSPSSASKLSHIRGGQIF